MSQADHQLDEQEFLFFHAQSSGVVQEHILRKLAADLKFQRGVTALFIFTLCFVIVAPTIFAVVGTILWGIMALVFVAPILVVLTPLVVIGFVYALPKVRKREERMRLAIARMEAHLHGARGAGTTPPHI